MTDRRFLHRSGAALLCVAVIIGCGRGEQAAHAPLDRPQIRVMEGFPSDPGRRHDGDFTPSGAFTKLSEHLYRFEDSCNVYAVIDDGGSALLIDYGSGDVLPHLRDMGVTTVERVLVTHHHRDQVQGLCESDSPPPVTVPAAEAQYFEDVERFWRGVQIYINYNCRSHWNTVRESIPVAGRVEGGDTVSWRGIDFRVLDTPGHTDGAVSYVAEIDGRTVAFTGDLIAGPGKVVTWFDLHWNYYGFVQGINASDTSFAAVRGERPDRLLPSHGDPIDDPDAAMAENSRIYETLRPMLIPNEMHRPSREMREILPHLVYLGATGYAIISDSGHAILYDYGYVDGARLAEFKKRCGIVSIDAVTFSHYHDDHCIRAWELKRRDPAEMWIFEKMLDVFERPERYRLPCLLPFPIHADRVLDDGEKVVWEEYTLEFFHMPGQTEFHQGMVTEIDGKTVMFTGDNTWKKADHSLSRNGPVVPHNEYFLDGGFIVCAQKMLDYMPDIVCPAHTEEYSPTRPDLEQFLDWAHRLRDVMTGLIDQPDPNFGMDYRWCRFNPFRSVAGEGEPFTVELRLRNHLYVPAEVSVTLKTPDDVRCARPEKTFTVEAKQQVAVPFELTLTGAVGGERRLITADITVNGRRIGEYAEAIVDVKDR